jgi:hypothetical protein
MTDVIDTPAPISAAAPDSVDELRGRAEAGDAAATTQLAKRLLVGRDAPFVPEEGMQWLNRAVAAGEPDALSVMATLKGAGAWTSQSWDESLDLLERAAARGSQDAREQLCLIAGDAALAARARAGDNGEAFWRALRQSVDLRKFVTPEPPRQVNDIPRIWLTDNFADPALCRWLIGRGQGKFKPALMFDGQKASPLDSRTCSDFVFDIVDSGVVMLLLRIRISGVTSIPIPNMEPPQIFHYSVGQEIKPHYDFLYDGGKGYGPQGKYQGDRLATFLMWLNDDYEGGELEFTKVGYRCRGKSGDGVFFASQRDGKPDKQSLHAAKPVTKGEKYILSQWIHDRPFEL